MLKLLTCLISLTVLQHTYGFIIIILFCSILCLPVKSFVLFTQSIRILNFRCHRILSFCLCICLLSCFFFFCFPVCRFHHLRNLNLLLTDKILQFFPVKSYSNPNCSGRRHHYAACDTQSFFSAAKFIAAFQSGCPTGFISFIIIKKEIFVLACCRRFFVYLFCIWFFFI